MAEHNKATQFARLIAEMEKHLAFLEGALGADMEILFSADDVQITELTGNPEEIGCRLMFPSPTAESGYVGEGLEFDSVEDLVAFLEAVVVLFRTARAQHRGE
jgi:hypothetical protein